MNVRRMKDGWTPVFLAATFGTSQVVRWVSGSQGFRKGISCAGFSFSEVSGGISGGFQVLGF